MTGSQRRPWSPMASVLGFSRSGAWRRCGQKGAPRALRHRRPGELGAIDLYYEDHGAGRPVVLIHGFPLSGRSWEKQARPCSRPATGSSPTTAAASATPASRRSATTTTPSPPTSRADDDARPARRHAGRLLDGHRRGGPLPRRPTARRGSARPPSLAAIPPFLLKTADNPRGGRPAASSTGIKAAIAQDRLAYLSGLLRGLLQPRRPRWATASARGRPRQLERRGRRLADRHARRASPTWLTDFRADLPKIDVPTLVLHGDADRILPIAVTGRAAARG